MTNTVFHSDYGNEIAGFKVKNQNVCTHFRDAFIAGGDPRRTEMIDAAGERMTLRQLDKLITGPWVQYSAKDYAGDLEIIRISIVPDD